jgi:hypothetical protein
MKAKEGSLNFAVAISLFVILNYSLMVSVASAEDSIKILTLGDSITQAESNRASYRYPLWKN